MMFMDYGAGEFATKIWFPRYFFYCRRNVENTLAFSFFFIIIANPPSLPLILVFRQDLVYWEWRHVN